MEPQGLAASGGQPEITLQQVIELIKQGMDPQEIIAAGVDPKLVEQAMMAVSQEMQAVPQEGLAGMQTQGSYNGL